MKMKIISAILLSFVCVAGLPGTITAPTVSASRAPINNFPTPSRVFLASLPPSAPHLGPKKIIGDDGRESIGVKTTATRIYVVDETSGTPLLAVRENDPLPLASITKLMTARVLLDKGLDWDKNIVMKDVVPDGGAPYFKNDDVVTVRDLWNAMLVGSSNTAARELVFSAGMEIGDFAALMNASAAKLGMENSHFAEPTGLDSANISTARDVALLADDAFSREEISGVLSLSRVEINKKVGGKKIVYSTNKLLDSFINGNPYEFIGGKTGFINESGYNMVISVSRKNAAPVTVVVMGAADSDLRFQEAKSLAYWAFENYRWQ
jgi:D-alanyl-D-alanine carboxypeptidase